MIKIRLRLIFLMNIFFLISSLLSCESSKNTYFFSGVWHTKQMLVAYRLNSLDEAIQPYKLTCDNKYYWGWVGSTKIKTIDVNPYVARINGSIVVLDILKEDKKFILNVGYWLKNTNNINYAKIIVFVKSQDVIWFEPDSSNQQFLDLLESEGFLYGPDNEYIRSPEVDKDTTTIKLPPSQ